MSGVDAQLLDRLGAALETIPSAPTVDEIASLRRLISDNGGVSAPAVVGLSRRPVRRRVRRVALAAALAAALVFGGGAVALATGGPFSGVARRAAFAIGLPVDSPELSNAKNALAGLRGALAGHDDRRIADARQDVDRRLAVLSADDARDVSGDARELLREADERLGRGHDQDERTAPDGTGRSGPSGDDRSTGGGERGSGGGSGSTPNAGSSTSGSGSDGGGGSTPTTSPGGSGGSGDGGHDGGSSDGGSAGDGGSGSGH